MPEPLLPLFPLGVVLFPRTSLPLHIFEERYKSMIGQAADEGTEFGVVWARDRGLMNVGCTAMVRDVVKKYDDGRMDILTVGRRRFELRELDNELAYTRGAVEFFDDEDPLEIVRRDYIERAIRGYYACRALSGGEALPEPDLNDPKLSFQLAQPIGELEFRQMLLMMRSEAERLKRLAEYFPVYISKERRTGYIRAIAPRNGHAKTHSNGDTQE